MSGNAGVNPIYALQSRHSLPNRGQFWTIEQDYTADVDRALQFKTQQEADQWLSAHRHLRGSLRVVEVHIPQAGRT
jgi:hypothetical protein